MTSARLPSLRRGLLAATLLSTPILPGTAWAQDVLSVAQLSPDGAIVDPAIVTRDEIDPNAPAPGGSLDLGITGIGQVVTDQGGGFVGLCTGTLINPRTVIFAAHCVNEVPASAYGAASGGTGIMVGFNDDTLDGIIDWLLGGYASDPTTATFNVEQVWYDPRSLESASCTVPGSCFLQADIAIATLDTPATGIPTWAMLFTPLDGPTHGIVTGYGNAGNANSTSIAIDFRRRAAENIISLLGSLDDVDNFLFGTSFTGNPQNLYQTSFDSPDPSLDPFDFTIFGGSALPREGTTAPGDSGGPLIADERYDIPVVTGVLSGGSRYFSEQAPWNYGTSSFYQPLFLYWEEIVANNPYVYAGTRAGSGNWEDPNHWVQLMDPSYMIDVDGELVNGLPSFRSDGTAGNGPKFGSVCFLTTCNDLSDEGSPLPTSRRPIVVPGGPGSRNFVPDNVVADPAHGVRARYYDVTLGAIGTTTLRSEVTVDVLTISNALAKLDVRPQGNLTVLGDFTQWGGWTNVDGVLASGETLITTGILTGRGRLDPTFLTLGAVLVAPAATGAGTLTVQGNVVFTSATTLSIELGRSRSDVLAVLSDGPGTGIAALDGTLLLTPDLSSAPRDGSTYQIVTAQGGVDGRFDNVANLLGLLRPQLTYGANAVTVKLKAGSIFDFIRGLGGLAEAFGRALDALRDGHYYTFSNLYGAIDLMQPQALAMTLNRLAPDNISDSRSLEDRQSRMMLNTVTDRLSMLGTVPGGTLSVATDTGVFAAMAGNPTPSTLGFNSIVPTQAGIRALPEGMTGFVSSGYSLAGSTLGSDRFGSYGGQQSWHVNMGLEMEVAPHLVMGTAIGYSDGLSRPDGRSRTDSRTSQLAVYGSYRLGGGAYLAGVASADMSRFDLARDVAAGPAPMNLNGATHSSRMSVRAEAGVNMAMAGLMFTPRVAMAYSSYRLDGFREQGGEAALQFDTLGVQQLESRIGMQLTGARRLSGGWSFRPQIQADMVRVLAGADEGLTVRFALAPEQAIALPVTGGDSTWGEVRGGFRLANGPVELGAALETSVGRAAYRDDRAVADVTFRF